MTEPIYTHELNASAGERVKTQKDGVTFRLNA